MSALVDPVTPRLWRACLAGDTPLMEQEMVRADPHTLDRNGETCLHMAARSGEVKAIERLLEEGLRLDLANNNGQTPLHVAANLDLVNIARTILVHGGNVDATTKFSGMTALHLACRQGHEDMVRLLLDMGANCAITDQIKKWPDFYTTNQAILDVFDKHFEVCTHGRRKGQQTQDNQANIYTSSLLDSALLSVGYNNNTTAAFTGSTISRDASRESIGKRKKSKKSGRLEAESPDIERDGRGVAVIDDDAEVARTQERNQRGRGGPEFGDIQHGDVDIYDKNASYDPDRDQGDEGAIKRNDHKLKINHKMEFSDQHRKRMQQNVFDRLLGASKKKEATDKN